MAAKKKLSPSRKKSISFERRVMSHASTSMKNLRMRALSVGRAVNLEWLPMTTDRVFVASLRLDMAILRAEVGVGLWARWCPPIAMSHRPTGFRQDGRNADRASMPCGRDDGAGMRGDAHPASMHFHPDGGDAARIFAGIAGQPVHHVESLGDHRGIAVEVGAFLVDLEGNDLRTAVRDLRQLLLFGGKAARLVGIDEARRPDIVKQFRVRGQDAFGVLVFACLQVFRRGRGRSGAGSQRQDQDCRKHGGSSFLQDWCGSVRQADVFTYCQRASSFPSVENLTTLRPSAAYRFPCPSTAMLSGAFRNRVLPGVLPKVASRRPCGSNSWIR